MFKKTLLTNTLLCFVLVLTAQNPLLIPATLSGDNIQLNIAESTIPFYSGFNTNTMGVNGAYLGPTLLLNKGDLVTMNVQNSLNETTTIHWHGMHVSAKNDGGPHTVIPPGTTWSPSFEVLDKAATYWYHPHLHEKTAEHVTKGIAGFIIVRDDEEAALELPRTYGLDDFPIVLQTRAFDAEKQFIVESAMDNVMLVNGTIDPYLEVPAQVIRLRLLNGSTERVYNLGFSNNLNFYQIASDGGLLTASVSLTRLRLAPGERAEILLDLSGLNGQSLYLKSFASELPSGIYGASNPSAMPMGSIQGYTNNDFNGNDFNILQLDIKDPTPDAISSIPIDLVPIDPWLENDSDVTRSLLFQPQQMGPSGMVNGPFVINGQLFDMSVINITAPLDNTEIWELTNQTAIAHPFHIHDVQFYILDINGSTPPVNMQGRKDVVLVQAFQTVRFITKFEDFADADVPFMYHCHMLTHEDAGMMGQFLVTGNTTGTTKADLLNTKVSLYPNPATDYLYISVEDENIRLEKLSVFNAIGKLVLQIDDIEPQNHEIDISQFPNGSYFIEINTDQGIIGKKVVLY